MSIVMCSVSLRSSMTKDCDCSSCSFTRQRSRRNKKLGAAMGAFELLAGSCLGAAANFEAAFGTECSFSWNSPGVTPIQLVLDD